MIDFLYSVDVSVLYFFNHTLSAPFLDKFFGIITNVNNWYISYLILLGISFTKGGRRGKFAVAGVLILILVTDQFGARLVKEWIQRPRPCNALPDVITPLGCNGTFSFPSNHSLNNFAAAVFFYKLFPKIKWAVFTAATLVALSRVYMGLHYPSDILGGAIIGSLFGYAFSYAVLKADEYFENKNKRYQVIKN